MEIEDVWMGFYLHGLLNDIRERRDSGEEVVLELPHDAASQGERLRPALQARNQRMIGPGQENWSHACNLCCWISTDAGTISASVSHCTRKFTDSQKINSALL